MPINTTMYAYKHVVDLQICQLALSHGVGGEEAKSAQAAL